MLPDASIDIDATDRITLGDDWVDMRRRLTSRDWKEIMQGITQLRERPSEAPEVVLRNTAYQVLTRTVLRRAIVAWSLKDKDGNPVPVTLTSLSNLKASAFRRLFQELFVRNPQFEEAGRRMFAQLFGDPHVE